MEKKQLTTVIILIVIAALGYFGLQMWRGEGSDSSLFAPETANPFGEGVNPYENIKTNPFE